MQHEPLVAAQRPRAVEAKRNLATDAACRVMRDQRLGSRIRPQSLHVRARPVPAIHIPRGLWHRDGGRPARRWLLLQRICSQPPFWLSVSPILARPVITGRFQAAALPTRGTSRLCFAAYAAPLQQNLPLAYRDATTFCRWERTRNLSSEEVMQ